MKRTATVALLLVALLLVAATPSHAWVRHGFHHAGARVFVGVGPVWWGPPYPYWYYPAPVYVTPPPVVVQEPPVYVQQPQVQVAPAPPPPPAASESFWYYCSSARGYYPTVQSCPEAWIKVAPRTQ